MPYTPLYPGREPTPNFPGYHHDFSQGDKIVTKEGELAEVLTTPCLGHLWCKTDDGRVIKTSAWSADYLRKRQLTK